MEKYIEENIESLRKQRDNKEKGGYRDLVVQTYKYIEKKIDRSANDYCNPKNKDISTAVFKNNREEKQIRKFVMDLKLSGYLLIEGKGADRTVKIIKELDF